jgi:hypothetical protein
MSTEQPNTDQIGKSAKEVDAEQPGDAALAEHLGMDVDRGSSRDVQNDAVDAGIVKGLVEEVRELRDTVENQQETIQNLAEANNELRDRVEDLEDQEETTRDIARSAIAKAEQLDADPDQQEDAEGLPAGVEPSTSPLDFFANCRQTKVKTIFVEESNRQNTYRAVKVAKRWKEFATRRSDGTGVFMTRSDVEDALTAILDGKPHRQTVARVWDRLAELGGDDIREKTRQVGRKQDKKELLAMDMETAERLLEKRYIGMDLLDGGEAKATTGGVTPVVTGEGGQPA